MISPENLIVGKFYKVPSVRVTTWNGFRGWLPVVGPKHEDAEFINFPWSHFHIDWRFVPQRILDYCGRPGPEAALAWPVQCPDSRGARVILETALRRMKCKREAIRFPVERAEQRWLPELRKKYACAKLTNGVCPHRGIPVSAMHRDGDVLTCPGHGLRWHAITGELIKVAV